MSITDRPYSRLQTTAKPRLLDQVSDVLHWLVLDGVYRRTEGEPLFHEARASTRDEL